MMALKSMKDAEHALKEAENALARAIRREENLKKEHYLTVSEVVHDIKNPLTAMMGYISLMKNEIAGPLGAEVYSQYIDTLNTSSNRLLTICETLLGRSRDDVEGTDDDVLDSQKIQDVDAAKVIGEIVDLYAAKAMEREINLVSDIDENFPILRASPQAIYRMLVNLMSNALKFTPKKGTVTVEAKTSEGGKALVVVVRDSGVGMTPDQIKSILDPNVTYTSVSPHGDEGTGLGLPVVNRLIHDLHGKMDIVSTENKGTKIKLEIPKEFLA